MLCISEHERIEEVAPLPGFRSRGREAAVTERRKEDAGSPSEASQLSMKKEEMSDAERDNVAASQMELSAASVTCGQRHDMDMSL